MKLTKLLTLSIAALALFGCSSKLTLSDPSLPMESYGDIFTIANNHQAETIPYIDEWVQPANKTEACLTFSSVTEDMEKISETPGFITYWDGECRNGYAYGLGREFTITIEFIATTLAEYAGNNSLPKYYQQLSTFDAYTLEGDLMTGVLVASLVHENGDVEIMLGDFAYDETRPAKLMEIRTNEKYIVHQKIYPEFTYLTANLVGGDAYETLIQAVQNKSSNEAYTANYSNEGRVSYVNNGHYVNFPITFNETMYTYWAEVNAMAKEALKAREIAVQKHAEYKARVCDGDKYIAETNVQAYRYFCEIESFDETKETIKNIKIDINSNFDSTAQKLQKETNNIIDELTR